MEKKGGMQIDSSNECQFGIQVLTMAWWPSYKQGEVKLPPQVTTPFEQFKLYYAHKHAHRRLTVSFSMGQAVVLMHSAAGAQKKIELVCTTLQMAILMFFNEVGSEGVTVRQIMDMLSIDEDSAKKNIQTMSGAKMKILRIATAKEEIPESSQESMMIDSS